MEWNGMEELDSEEGNVRGGVSSLYPRCPDASTARALERATRGPASTTAATPAPPRRTGHVYVCG